MYYQSSARPNDPQEPESDRLKTLLDNLNNLRGKLKNFTVIDELGQPIGEINDLILDAGHQLNLVIAQPETQEHQSSVLLNGRRIKKVSVQTQSVFVDITKADVRFLPEYLLPDETATGQTHPEGLVENHVSVPPPLEVSESPLPIEPDFSLDVMEAPADSATSASNEALDFLDLQDSTTSGPSDDFLELETPIETPTSDSLDTTDDLFELELPNEARSLDEFGLLDSSASSPADELPDLDLALDETIESNTVVEALPEMAFASDTSSELDSTDEWEEFDRIMAIEPESTSSDLNGSLGDFSDTNPLPEDFALVQDLASSDTSGAPLAESFTLEDPPSSNSIELPEISLDEGSLDFPTENYLPELGTEESQSFPCLNFTEDSSPELNLDESENLSSLDFTVEGDSPDLGFGESENLPSLDLQLEDNLPELSLGESEDLASLDFSTEDNSADFSIGESESLPSLDFSVESDDLLDLSNQSETLQPLDFPGEDNLPELTLSEPAGLASLDFSTEDNLSDLGTSENEGLPSLDFTLEDNGLPELTIEESESLSSLDLSSQDDWSDLSIDESANLSSLNFTTEDNSPDLSFEEAENLASLDFATEDNLAELPELNLDQTESSSTLAFEAENALPELELNSSDDFSSLDLTSSIDNSAEDATDSMLMETTPSNDVEAQWAEFDREINLPAVDLSALDTSSEPSTDNFSESNFGDFGEPSDNSLPDLDFGLEDTEESLQETFVTDTFESLDFDNQEDSSQTDLGLADLEVTAESPPATDSFDFDNNLSELDFTTESSSAPESFGDSAEDVTLETDEASASLDLSFGTELPSSDLVGDSDEVVFTEDGEIEEEADLSTISSLADLDFTLEAAEPESLDFAEFGTPSELPNPSISDETESIRWDDANPLPELSLADEAEPLNPVESDTSMDLDFGASPELVPDLSLGEFSTSSENLNLDESIDFASESQDLNLDENINFTSDFATETADLGIHLPEPPALNLDALELSGAPDLSNPELSFGSAPIADIDPLGITAEGVDSPEFGLASIPAETYDLPGNGGSEEVLGTDELQNIETTLTPDAVDAIVPLLEERLKVEYERRKVGEVVVRKRIETRMVQVPVRYEKLVIEQLGDNPKTLAEVDLSQGALDNLEVPNITGSTQVSGEFKSAKTAGYVLDAIAKTLRDRCKNVRIEVELDDPKLQKAYQDWLNQCSQIE